MILTTSHSVSGFEITDYKGIVFGEVITGINFVKDIGAGFRNFFGGRCEGYEEELMEARTEAIQEMETRAKQMGADAVIGVKMDYETLGEGSSMLMVTCSGTAVVLTTK